MVLKLYGTPSSAFVQKVLIALLETNSTYELVAVDTIPGGSKGPTYLAKNPFGTIPCIDDDGFVLFESAAIAQYIAAKAGSPLLPTGDLQRVARYDQAVCLANAQFEPAFQPIVYERLGHLLPNGSAPDEERVATLVEKLETKLAAYEAMLGKHKYLAGDDLTLADLFHVPWGAFAAPQEFTWFEDKEKYPNLSRWWADISSRKSWKEVQRLAHMSSPMYGAMMKPRSQT